MVLSAFVLSAVNRGRPGVPIGSTLVLSNRTQGLQPLLLDRALSCSLLPDRLFRQHGDAGLLVSF